MHDAGQVKEAWRSRKVLGACRYFCERQTNLTARSLPALFGRPAQLSRVRTGSSVPRPRPSGIATRVWRARIRLFLTKSERGSPERETRCEARHKSADCCLPGLGLAQVFDRSGARIDRLDRREILQALRPCFWCAGAPGPVVSRRIIKTLRRLDNLSAKQLDFKSPAMHKPGVSMQTALLFLPCSSLFGCCRRRQPRAVSTRRRAFLLM
jgi:hypothetical protein